MKKNEGITKSLKSYTDIMYHVLIFKFISIDNNDAVRCQSYVEMD